MNDLIRYSLVPAVILPALVPALESVLIQLVPSMLGRAVAEALANKTDSAVTYENSTSVPLGSTAEVLRVQLASIRDQLNAIISPDGIDRTPNQGVSRKVGKAHPSTDQPCTLPKQSVDDRPPRSRAPLLHPHPTLSLWCDRDPHLPPSHALIQSGDPGHGLRECND